MQQPKHPEATSPYPNNIGWWIKKQGYTQEEVADEIGIARRTLSNYIAGKRVAPRYCLEKIAKTIGREIEDLTLQSEHQSSLSLRKGSESQQAIVSAQDTEDKREPPVLRVAQPAQKEAPTIWVPSQRAGLPAVPERLSERELGAWLVVNACHLIPLTEAGLSLESLLDVYPIILKVVQKMPKITRRRLIQLATAALVLNDIPILLEKHVSAEDRNQLHSALGETIGASWKSFQTADFQQLLIIGQAQLYLLEQNHSLLYSSVRPIFYSAVYRLIGAALFFQQRHREALDAHNSAYLVALQGGDAWNMAESLAWQAYAYQALGQHGEAIQRIEEALRLIGTYTDELHLRLRAHLLACWAENAAVIKEDTIVQEKLELSEALLERIAPNEEFDRPHWLQKAGNCALISEDYSTASTRFEEALVELPPHWTMRHAVTLLPLAIAHARAGKLDASLAVAKKALPLLNILNAPILNQQFIEFVQSDLLRLFPNDARTFITANQHQFPQITITAGATNG